MKIAKIGSIDKIDKFELYKNMILVESEKNIKFLELARLKPGYEVGGGFLGFVTAQGLLFYTEGPYLIVYNLNDNTKLARYNWGYNLSKRNVGEDFLFIMNREEQYYYWYFYDVIRQDLKKVAHLASFDILHFDVYRNIVLQNNYTGITASGIDSDIKHWEFSVNTFLGVSPKAVMIDKCKCLTNNMVLCSSSDSKIIFALELTTGKCQWQKDNALLIAFDPEDEDKIYYKDIVSGDFIICDPTAGSVLKRIKNWANPSEGKLAHSVIINSGLIIPTYLNAFYLLNKEDGSLVEKVEISPEPLMNKLIVRSIGMYLLVHSLVAPKKTLFAYKFE